LISLSAFQPVVLTEGLMRNTTKALAVTWECVPDRDYREKLRQAFAIIFGDNTHGLAPLTFDETRMLEQDEDAAKG
jgi:tRNA C32,U32 (ribose-2'-O)-methylase TrmJ